eukprot:14222624-Heterocapsa_arctica.AAC.1
MKFLNKVIRIPPNIDTIIHPQRKIVYTLKLPINGELFTLEAHLGDTEHDLLTVVCADPPRDFMLPFMQKYSADDCRRMLMNPSDQINTATLSFVQQMANGGVRPPTPPSEAPGTQAQDGDAPANPKPSPGE